MWAGDIARIMRGYPAGSVDEPQQPAAGIVVNRQEAAFAKNHPGLALALREYSFHN